MRITDVLDVLGLICVPVFAFFIWPPLTIIAAGGVLILVSFMLTKRGRK